MAFCSCVLLLKGGREGRCPKNPTPKWSCWFLTVNVFTLAPYEFRLYLFFSWRILSAAAFPSGGLCCWSPLALSCKFLEYLCRGRHTRIIVRGCSPRLPCAAPVLLLVFGCLYEKVAARVNVLFWLKDGAQYPVLFMLFIWGTIGSETPSLCSSCFFCNGDSWFYHGFLILEIL